MHLALMLAFLMAFNVGPNITSARAQNGCMPALSAAKGARQYAMAVKIPNRCIGVPRRQAAAELQEIAEKEVVRKHELRAIFT